MKVALTDRYSGEVHTIRATIESRVGFSLRGHLYLCLETKPGREMTWEHWQACKGTVVAVASDERKRLAAWEQNGRDYAAQWWKKKA